MNSLWLNICIIALWMATMSWLVATKILPSLQVGDPPDRVAALAAQAEDELVGYEVRWEEERIGNAALQTVRMQSGSTLVDGHIHFESLPIRRMLPEVLLDLVGIDGFIPSSVKLDAKNQVLFQSNGMLQRFDSIVFLSPTASTIRVEGFVAGETLILMIRSAGVTYETQRPLPRNAMVSDGLMPQSRLPGLYEGRKWTVEMYSPLRPRSAPMEIMQAEVVGRDLITWNGRVQNVWKVVYRGDPGGDVARAGREHAWLWVRDDGMVLQHRISVLDGAFTFVRMQDANASELLKLFRDPTATPTSETGTVHLQESDEPASVNDREQEKDPADRDPEGESPQS